MYVLVCVFVWGQERLEDSIIVPLDIEEEEKERNLRHTRS